MDETLTILPFDGSTNLSVAVLLLPLFSFFVLILWPKNNKGGAWLATTFMLIGLVISCYLFSAVWNTRESHARFVWFELNETLKFTAGIWLNNLTVLTITLVTLISTLVHLFSMEYMKDDKAYNRYFAFLGLFTFSMLGIVLSDNLLITFVFWELVGLSSYLLIGFWFFKESAASASKKAFIVNRIGDIGFLAGLMILWLNYNTLDLTILLEHINLSDPSLSIAVLCLFGGVIGKSAQFPLLVWLPDAMEGPTPVSALIHAATMVAAGVFLLARISPILPVEAGHIIALIGAVTAFMGGVAALHQFDIKKILAFSTISQLGYMVMAAGAGASNAAIFHLVTHAFFKAGLFLGAGAIIHALHQMAHTNQTHFDAQDIRLMGGLKKEMPMVYVVFMVFACALMGIPLFSGFLSKEAILLATLSMNLGWQLIVPILGFTSVLITAFYVVRMLLLVFFGENRLSNAVNLEFQKIPNSPNLITAPLILLAVGSLFVFFSVNPLEGSQAWIMTGLSKQEGAHSFTISIVSILLVALGGGLAYQRFAPNRSYVQQLHNEPNYSNTLQSLSFNNWHLDKIYNTLFVKQVVNLGLVIKKLDEKVIDRLMDFFGVANVIAAKIIQGFDKYVVDGLVHLFAAVSRLVGWLSKSIQTGKVQTHVAWAGVGVLVLIIWLIVY